MERLAGAGRAAGVVRFAAVSAASALLVAAAFAFFGRRSHAPRFPQSFTLALLVMVVLGGTGTLWGALLGGALYTLLDQRLGALGSSSQVQGLPSVLRTPLSEPLFVLGVLFILLVFFLPGGIAGLATRGRGLRRLRHALRGQAW